MRPRPGRWPANPGVVAQLERVAEAAAAQAQRPQAFCANERASAFAVCPEREPEWFEAKWFEPGRLEPDSVEQDSVEQDSPERESFERRRARPQTA